MSITCVVMDQLVDEGILRLNVQRLSNLCICLSLFPLACSEWWPNPPWAVTTFALSFAFGLPLVDDRIYFGSKVQ